VVLRFSPAPASLPPAPFSLFFFPKSVVCKQPSFLLLRCFLLLFPWTAFEKKTCELLFRFFFPARDLLRSNPSPPPKCIFRTIGSFLTSSFKRALVFSLLLLSLRSSAGLLVTDRRLTGVTISTPLFFSSFSHGRATGRASGLDPFRLCLLFEAGRRVSTLLLFFPPSFLDVFVRASPQFFFSYLEEAEQEPGLLFHLFSSEKEPVPSVILITLSLVLG